ncbi:competence protein CoiA [Halobacillus faecis]|uniref:Competence protein n=1 Tax=Halobacillus faecis TaxID=360184 RepID=A0A511WP09_9BACI|nr:competence protein CoiA family protein [Halobacillus faecis]GEN52886.1 competence protein [Halobacillus faecis]
MLYALNTNGELQSLYQLTQAEIELVRKTPYVCPVCHELLQIRSGRRTIPHFSHFPKSNCAVIKGGETVEHDRGKWRLFTWLKNQGYEVHLEQYLPEIRQRPDIYLLVNGKKIAIEYQCASVTNQEINKRTLSYRDAGIFPLWILGTKHLHSSNSYHLSLSDFTRSFFYYLNDDYYLYFFHASKGQICVLSNVKSAGGRRVFAKTFSSAITNLRFPQLFTPGSYDYGDEPFLREVERLWYKNRTVYQSQVSSEERQYRQYLYLRGYHFSLIPSICYLPVPGQVQTVMRPYVWQTRLFLDHFFHLPIESSVEFPILSIGSTPNGYAPHLSQQYLDLLTRLNIIEKTGKNIYIKIKQVSFHKRVEDALEDDRRTLEQLKNLQRIKI